MGMNFTDQAGRLRPDLTAMMNPQWARFFDRIAQTQGQDPKQPYDINIRGQRPSLSAMMPQPKPTPFDDFATDDLIEQSAANRQQSQALRPTRRF